MAKSGAIRLYRKPRAASRHEAGRWSGSIISRNVWCGSSEEAIRSRAPILSPLARTTAHARPSSMTISLGLAPHRTSPPWLSISATRARAREAAPPRAICALAGLASSSAMWWPKPRTLGSTSRSPLKNSRPAWIAGLRNSRRTNSSGESSATSSSRRPAALRCNSARRSAAGSGGAIASGRRMVSLIGTNCSCQRRNVVASARSISANEAAVRSRSVHHWMVRPSDRIIATLNSGSMYSAPLARRSRSAYHGIAVIARWKKACVLCKKPGLLGSSIVASPPPATPRRSRLTTFSPARQR